ncbi:MAG: hypothetical protein ACU0CA_17155 [Paracoccaceae bacterium]
MRNFVLGFIRDENGNAVIDWLVLTASVAVLGFAVGVMITASSTQAANGLSSSMEAMQSESTGSAATTLLAIIPRK